MSPLHTASTDLRLTFLDSFMWSGETRPGFPLLQMPDGTLCEAATAYFGYLCETGRGTPEYLRYVAYALRDWLAFVLSHERRWDEADDGLLRRWRECQNQLRSAQEAREDEQLRVPGADGSPVRDGARKAPASARIENKIAVVFAFYLAMSGSTRFDVDPTPLPCFVGTRVDSPRRPITMAVSINAKGKSRQMWENAERVKDRRPRLDVPSTDDVRRVAERLRDAGGSGGDLPAAMLEERRRLGDLRWLMAQCMVRAACRCSDVARLGVDDMWDALCDEHIVDGPSHTAEGYALDLASGDDELKERIRSGLELLRRRKREMLFVTIVRKGRPRQAKKVAFQIDLFLELLETGVWDARHKQVLGWKEADASYQAPRAMFLSLRTREAFKPGSIGDIVKDAFNDLKVKGSAHRLRAKAGVDFATRLLRDRLADNNFEPTEGVLDWVLEQLKDMMGHARISTTLKHYVSLLMVNYNSQENERSRREAHPLRTRIRRVLQELSVAQLGEVQSMLEKRFGSA